MIGARPLTDGTNSFAIAGMRPGTVTVPTTRAELAATLADATARGAAVVPCGLGAHLALGHAPERYDVALSTRALATIIDYAPADMTVTVESGTTLAALDALLAREDQWLPLDPPLPEATTVGGLVAADLSGPFRATYGRARDYVIGIAMTTAAGVETRAGGRVVKNVAGYDLMKLLVGSLGTLAVVTEVTLKVRPRPETMHLLDLRCAERDAAVALASRLADVGEPALALTMLATRSTPLVRCLLGGVAADVGAMRARLLDAARADGAEIEYDGDGAADAARARVAESRDLPRVGDGDLVVRVTGVRTEAPRLLAEILADLGSACTWTRFDPRAATSTFGVATPDPAGALARLGAAVARHQAVLVVERWPDALGATIDVWSPLPAALPLMRRVKTALDPTRTLAPGRFVGRL